MSKCHKKMTSEDVVKIFNARRILLKRSASATDGLNIPNLAALNLRDTKSFTGNMEEIKMQPQKILEKIHTNDDEIHYSDCIETKDIYNSETIVVNKEVLSHKGKRYGINDIAFKWKKDYRMWLWKNSWDLRKNKSVGEHLKSKLIKD